MGYVKITPRTPHARSTHPAPPKQGRSRTATTHLGPRPETGDCPEAQAYRVSQLMVTCPTGVLQGTHTAMDLALGQGHTAIASVLERAAAARR